MLQIHGFQNTRTTRALWALEEAGAEYELVVVDLARGEHRTPEFLGLSPGGKVPILVEDGFVMSESAAICTYVGEKFPASGLVPEQAQDRAHYFQWCFFAVTELEAPLWTMAKHQKFLPEERRIPGVADTCLWEFHRHAAIFALHIKGREFAVGHRFTAADILLAGTLKWALRAGINLESPALKDYVDRMYARPALARAMVRESQVVAA